MSNTPKVPPFVLPYQHGNSTFYMNSNRPIKAVAAQDWAARQVNADGDAFLQANISAFWIVEGFLYQAELDTKDFETLDYYLKARDGLALPERWKLYNDIVSFHEAANVVEAFNATRRNPFETETDTPVDEKKSD